MGLFERRGAEHKELGLRGTGYGLFEDGENLARKMNILAFDAQGFGRGWDLGVED